MRIYCVKHTYNSYYMQTHALYYIPIIYKYDTDFLTTSSGFKTDPQFTSMVFILPHTPLE